jgi:cobalt-zinc-cadmium resistance protein CzcA
VGQPKVISRKEALEASRAHYPGLQAIKEKLESQKTLKATASDLGKTNFGIQIGQYNSRDQDQYFSMSQSFPLPGAISRLREWYEQQAISGHWTLKKAEAELDLEVKNAFQEMVFGQEKIRFLMRLDSLFAQVKRASDLRLKAGETNELEAALAENQAMQVKTQIMSARSDLKMAMLGLQSLMQRSDSLVAEEEQTGDIALPEGSKEVELWIENHPFTQIYKQEEKVARSWILYEKTKIWPEFSLGYFNQSLRGTPLENRNLASGQNRFQGLMGTLSYPLWQKPGRQRIKAGQQLEKALQLETRNQRNRLEVRLKMAIQEWQKMKSQVAFLEKEGLPTALLIRKNAIKSFGAGDIGFLEFSQALKRSLDTELLWLESRHQLNLSKINIEFFTSQNL